MYSSINNNNKKWTNIAVIFITLNNKHKPHIHIAKNEQQTK